MHLSSRLTAIYEMIPYGIAADVGSDHGKLIISLYKNGKISKGYAIENKKGPFNRLVSAVKSENAESGVCCLLSDGITDLPDDCDTVIIAGMGGFNIVNILKAHTDKLGNVKTIVVDAHNAIKDVRGEITAFGFKICEEKIIKDADIYYEIIKFERGVTNKLNDLDLEYGPLLRKEKSNIFLEKHKARIKEIDNLLLNKDLPSQRVEGLKQEKERIKNIL